MYHAWRALPTFGPKIANATLYFDVVLVGTNSLSFQWAFSVITLIHSYTLNGIRWPPSVIPRKTLAVSSWGYCPNPCGPHLKLAHHPRARGNWSRSATLIKGPLTILVVSDIQQTRSTSWQLPPWQHGPRTPDNRDCTWTPNGHKVWRRFSSSPPEKCATPGWTAIQARTVHPGGVYQNRRTRVFDAVLVALTARWIWNHLGFQI